MVKPMEKESTSKIVLSIKDSSKITSRMEKEYRMDQIIDLKDNLKMDKKNMVS